MKLCCRCHQKPTNDNKSKSLKLEDVSSDANGSESVASPRHNCEPSLRQRGGVSPTSALKGIKSSASPDQRTSKVQAFCRSHRRREHEFVFLYLALLLVMRKTEFSSSYVPVSVSDNASYFELSHDGDLILFDSPLGVPV